MEHIVSIHPLEVELHMNLIGVLGLICQCHHKEDAERLLAYGWGL